MAPADPVLPPGGHCRHGRSRTGEVGRPVIGELPATLPAPSLAFLDPAAIPGLAGAAVAVAALAALESLLSATVADGKTVGSRHDPDRELFGQGLANVAAPLVAHIPVAALAGVLLATAIRMIEVGSVKVLMRASRSDAVILVLTAVVTLAIDLVWAVICGLVVAGPSRCARSPPRLASRRSPSPRSTCSTASARRASCSTPPPQRSRPRAATSPRSG